jgi:hypothetical protein
MPQQTEHHPSAGDQLIAEVNLKRRFHDAHERRAYARAVETAKRIVDDPALVERGRHFAERFMRPDPHMARYYEMWSKLLDEDPGTIARSLIEDSQRGALLRDSSPVFVAFTRRELETLRI